MDEILKEWCRTAHQTKRLMVTQYNAVKRFYKKLREVGRQKINDEDICRKGDNTVVLCHCSVCDRKSVEGRVND
jgi:hypothetical protein